MVQRKIIIDKLFCLSIIELSINLKTYLLKELALKLKLPLVFINTYVIVQTLLFNDIFFIFSIEDCEICLIDLSAFVQVAMSNPSYILALCEKTLTMFQHSIFNFISLAHNQVNGRIANILIYLWEHVYKESGYDFTISRKEIAEFAACSHENVITTLSRFKKDGIIELEGKKIIIKNFEGLTEISKKG